MSDRRSTAIIGRWIAKTLVVFVLSAVVSWHLIGPRPATTFSVSDVLGAAFLFAVVFAAGYNEGRSDSGSDRA